MGSLLSKIFKKYLRATRTKSIDLNDFADKTEGMSPADIEMICLNAIKEVILYGKKSLTGDILEEYIEKQSERIKIKNRIMSGE